MRKTLIVALIGAALILTGCSQPLAKEAHHFPPLAREAVTEITFK